jgi:penicillin-binding protein 1A
VGRPSLGGVRLAAALAALIIAAPACGAVSNLDEEMAKAPPLAQTSKIYDSRGNLITTLHAEEDRELIPLTRIPETVQDAVVAIEDQRFWHHRGIDVKAILRAAYVNATTGEIQEGASTITQQYVRNAFTGVGTEETFGRKMREASLALQLEEQLSKGEILSRYLNTVYFGQGAYGIERAAETFFSRPADDLNLTQGALLAGLIAGPGRWDPIDKPKAALLRRNRVLAQMQEVGYITSQKYQRAAARPLGLHPSLRTGEYQAPWFVNYVKHEILTDERFGESYTQRFNFLFKGGLRIFTTIDLRMQRAAEQAVRSILYEESDPYAALTAIDPRTGEIKAMVGGRDYFVRPRDDPFAKINLATGGSTGRQAGSAYKVYALVAALESGIPLTRTYPGSSIVLDEPPCGSPDNPWNVENYEGSSYGSLTVEQATISSVNVIYAQIIRDVGPEKVNETARRMGIRSKLRPYCSSVLGTNEVNTLEMASAIGTLSTNGVRYPPYAIERIEGPDGAVIFEASPKGRQVVNPAIAWTATQVLEKVITSGTGTAANIGRPAAGKTGTAQMWRDAWFYGFVPQLTAAVWVGYPQGQIPMIYPRTRISRVYGGSYPAEIWHAFMAAATSRMKVLDFERPAEEFVTVAIDITQGCVATESTPDEYVREIQFTLGTAPTRTCEETAYGPAKIPSVIGMASSAAFEILQEAGFTVEQVVQATDGYPSSTVIDQYPDAGTEADAGTEVTVTVAG